MRCMTLAGSVTRRPRSRDFPQAYLLAAVVSLVLALAMVVGGAFPARAQEPDVLTAGQTLSAGQFIESSNQQYRAVVQTDGNVVVYGPGNSVEFATNTGGTANPELTMQTDGNLVLYGSSGPRWWTGSSGANAKLAMQNDGNLVMYADGRAAWSIRGGLIPRPPMGPVTLNAGQTLTAGQMLVSANRQYQAVLQTDGNLVVYGPNNQVLFATNTGGTANPRLAMQPDGNLVLYGASGPQWWTGTSGANAQLSMQDDGNLVLYTDGRAAWASRGGVIPRPPMGPVSLNSGQSLTGGQMLMSANQQYRAVVQTDGNVVEYGPSGQVLWATNTGGTANPELALQTDGNLVLYGSGGARWSTATGGAKAQLSMQDDGNLVLYAGGRAAWASRGGFIPYPSFSGNGGYVVGQQIAAGTYRTRTDSTGCYWERLRGFSGSSDEIIANNFSDFHDVVTISPSDVGFTSSKCATWTQDLRSITSSPTASFGSGTFIVGTDIAAGTWSPTGGADCYWERVKDFSGTFDGLIANNYGSSLPVTISASDAGFSSTNCGVWTKVG